MSTSKPFQPVSLKATGSQQFRDRFPGNKPHDENIPIVQGWRCNLTGLSSVYNLYFVAYLGDIYVYEPQFPEQSLSSRPALIIHTEASTPNSGWRTAPGQPRTINRLTVQFLGDEEVVVVVRDDGDVEGYYTRHIYQAIEKRMHFDTTLGVSASDVRPFFHRNAGHSVWGVAIHSKARMIAVSTNAFRITIFTFALTREEPDGATGTDGDDTDDEDSPILEEEDYYYSSDASRTPPSDRKRNDVRIILNGWANVPEIAFCNTADDETGRWLMTADISGLVRTWDVHTLSCEQMYRSNLIPSLHPSPRGLDRRNAVWGLMFLDHLCFRETDTVDEALGVQKGDMPIDMQKFLWDQSSTVNHVKGAREPFKLVRPPVKVLDGNYADPLATTRPAALPAMSTISLDATNESDEDEENDHDDEDEDEDRYEGEDEDEDEDGNRLRPTIGFKEGQALFGDLPCPILHLSVKDMYLFQPASSGKAWHHLPVIAHGDVFAQPLQTTLQPNEAGSDRINMHAQIPSLGVVVIATQKGRVAIISLTSIITSFPDFTAQPYLTNPNDQTSSRYPTRTRRLYGCRVDHILPLASQEAAGHRPRNPLHGIAVGPVQGTEELDDDQERWRLMIMYQDHTVLTYEIGKPKSDTLGLDLMAL